MRNEIVKIKVGKDGHLVNREISCGGKVVGRIWGFRPDILIEREEKVARRRVTQQQTIEWLD